MAITTAFDYSKCLLGGSYKGVVLDPTSAVTTGTTYVLSGECVQINSVSYKSPSEATVTFDSGPFNNCGDCFASIYDYVAIVDCINEQTYYVEFSGFTGNNPQLHEIYFIELLYRGVTTYNCYEVKSFGNYDPENPVNYAKIISLTLSTTCPECLNSSFLVYQVTPCLGTSPAYVGLSSSDYTGHLISYVDGLGDQYCGTVGDTPTANPQTVTFISDYGVFADNCDECNSQVAEQRILTNCITGNEVIVWNSLFFNGGETSNLSSSDGCFSVGNVVTGQTVDINEFLNFDPQPSCAECIQCNGIQYNYTTCEGRGPISSISYSYTGTSTLQDNSYNLTGETNNLGSYSNFNVSVAGGTVSFVSLGNGGISYSTGDTITILGSNLVGGMSPDDDIIVTVNSVTNSGSILSYQYLNNPVGTVFYNPPFNECCEITSTETPTTYTFAVSSLETFNTCLDCVNQDHYVWYATECGLIGDSIIITTTVGFGIGDIVKVKIGDSDYLCYELVDVYDYGVYGPVNAYNSLTTESYSTCDECKGTVRVGVSVLSCETNEVTYVNIPLNAWYAVAGYSEVFEGLIISDYQGNCYRVINSCPINVNGNNLDVQHIFTSCSVCYDYYHPIIHVNQYYETIITGVVNGPGDLSQIVTFNVPHPIWTDGNDTRRTLIQDNAVTLGGFNGLNN